MVKQGTEIKPHLAMERLLMLIVLGLSTMYGAASPTVPFLKQGTIAPFMRLIDTRDGLAENAARSVYQLRDRRLLLQTEGSICFYDGESFSTLVPKADESMAMGRSLTCATQTSDGLVWIRHGDRLCLLDYRAEHFVKNPAAYIDQRWNINGPIDDVVFDNLGGIWITTHLGYVHHIWNDGRLQHPILCRLSNFSSVWSTADRFVLLSTDGSMWILHASDLKLIHKTQSLTRSPKPLHLSYSFVQRGNKLFWAYNDERSEGHLMCLDLHSFEQIETSRFPDFVHSLAVLADGSILGSSINSLYHFDGAGKLIRQINLVTTNKESTLVPNVVYMYADRNGGIWSCLNNRGLLYYNPSTVRFRKVDADQLPLAVVGHSAVQCIMPLSNHEVLVGFEQGVWRYDIRDGRFSPVNSLADANSLALTQGSNGYIYLSTRFGPVYQFNRTLNHFRQLHFVTTQGESISNVRALYDFPNSGCWLLSKDFGVCRIARSDLFKSPIVYANPLRNRFPLLKTLGMATHAILLPHNRILFASQYGLFVYDVSTDKVVKTVLKESNSQIPFRSLKFNHVVCDSRGWLWLGTHEGLMLYIPQVQHVQEFTAENGLPNNTVQGIVEVSPRQMYISTSNGIAVIDINPQNAEKPVSEIRQINESSGLLEGEYVERSVCRMADGTLLLGGVNGLSIIEPSAMRSNNTVEIPIFSSLRVKGVLEHPGGKILDEALGCTSRIVLPYDCSSFSLHFAVPEYKNPELIRYRYRLNQSSQNAPWVYITGREHACEASFYFLPPGKYTLEVQASVFGGSWNAKSAQMEIVVQPPFYWNFWSKTLYLLLLLTVFGYFRYMHRRQAALQLALKLQEERNRLSEGNVENRSHEVFDPRDLHIATTDEELLRKVRDVFYEHISEPDFGVEQLGREVGMARVTLYRKIKSLTGETPVILMRTLRLRLAAQYLRAGRTVQETAEMVGFTDTAYFRKRFKEMYGVLPTEYS